MKHTILFSVLLLFNCIASAQGRQRIQLSGRITDAVTGEPLTGTSVTLIESRVGTTSDSTGNFVLNNVPLGHATLEITHSGYKSIIEHIDIAGSTARNFAMMPSIVVNEAITITAVGSATSIRKAPIPITRVNKGELLASPSTNIIDALTRQPGVNQLSTGPAISKPIIRGLGYNRLVVVNDGIRQEGQQWGDEHGIEIDENSVSRVEIVKGPASLIYGSDAIAGVINIITTAPAPNNTIRGSVLSSYQTNNRQRSLFGNFGGNVNGVNWNVWGDYKGAMDYRNKYDGRVFNSKFNEKNFGGYFGLNRSWGFSHFIVSHFNQRVGVVEGERNAQGQFVKIIPGGAEVAATPSDFTSMDPRTPYQHIRHLKFISENSFKTGSGRTTLNMGWQRNRRQEFGNPDDPAEKSLYFDLPTFNYNVTYHFDDKGGWTTSVGLNGMRQGNSNMGVEVLIPEYTLFDVGAYIYTQKTVGKTTFSGGIRYDKRDVNAEKHTDGSEVKFVDFKKKFYNVSGSAGFSYAASDNFLLKVNLARGFRAPSIPELSSNGAHEGTNRYEYGNLDLRSETSFQGDLALELNSEHVLFQGSAFYNHISNFIYYTKLRGNGGGDSLVMVDTEYIPAFKFQQQSAKLAGAEFLMDIHPHPFDWFHWENRLSYVRGIFSEAVEGTKNVPNIPATRWVSELRAEILPKGKILRNLVVSVEADFVRDKKRAFIAFGTETPTPGYTLLNGGISANIMSSKKTLFTFYLLGNNLTNVAYQSHLSRLKYAAVNQVTGRQGVFNMGRNFMVRVNVPLWVDVK